MKCQKWKILIGGIWEEDLLIKSFLNKLHLKKNQKF